MDTLRDHSAPYKDGAWERFAASQHKGKKISPIWYWSSAAAMMLLGVALFINNYLFEKREALTKRNTYTHVEPENKKGYLEQDPSVREHLDDDRGRLKDNQQPKSTLALKPLRKYEDQKTIVFEKATTVYPDSNKGHQVAVASAIEASKMERDGTEVSAGNIDNKNQGLAERDRKVSKEEALIRMLNEGNTDAASSAQNALQQRPVMAARKWNVGVILSPSLSDERVNMGGGVSVAYQLSKKVSIGSGVSLVDLGFRQSSPNIPGNGGRMMDAAPVSTALTNESPMYNAKTLETKELTSINTNLLALDIPIDIKYQVSKQFYASAGISFFAVLNEDRTNNFLTRAPTDRTLQSADGFAFSQPEFQIKSVSEKASETPYQGNGYSGFLNFSVGRKMPLSNKIGIAVEPFIKIPVGSLSNQDMNLRYGGLRIITSF